MRRCRVLMRKVLGTDWPPARVEHRGEPASLEAIFADAGIALECERHGPDLPPLLSGRAFGLFELRAGLAAQATGGDDPDGGWLATVLIVPDIVDTTSGRFRRPLGMMLGRDDGDRAGCALAFARVASEPRGFLRTLAHELGHVFNLGHPGEGPVPLTPDAVNTLMVPTDRLRPPGRFPDTIEFRFAPADRAWLASAPEQYVRPGGMPYGARPPAWP